MSKAKKINRIIGNHGDALPDQILAEVSDTVANIEPQQVAMFTEWADMWDAAAKESGIQDEPCIHLSLDGIAMEMLEGGLLEDMAPVQRLRGGRTLYSTIETSELIRALATQLKVRQPLEQMAILTIIDQVMTQIEDSVAEMAAGEKRGPGKRGTAKTRVSVKSKKAGKAKKASPGSAKPVYQIKITLLRVNLPVWRRILIKDCSLDMLHGFIQTSMGWTNSHMHQFIIGKEYYGDTETIDSDWIEDAINDSLDTVLSDVVPGTGKRFRFRYEYDFGDSWEHEILVEKMLAEDKSLKYPLCVGGSGACPPEDIGGPYGYADLMEALADPKHERHEEAEELLEAEGPFDPNAFNADEATKAIRRIARARTDR